MKVFIAGATGVLGRRLAQRLVAAGHEVTGLTRSPERGAVLTAIGARAAVADALDYEALNKAVQDARPTHVAHLLTALPPGGAIRPSGLVQTNRLRIDGTASLLRAAISVGARRLVAESFVAVYGAADFEAPRDEADPLPPAGNGPLRETVLALRSLEEQLRVARERGAIETVALRFGLLYGKGVPSVEETLRQIRAGRIATPRGATGVASFVHVDDAVSAIVAALEHEAPGP
ncbi:MAG TPA: NAD(P)-dependent oxidoreductase, partial [Terriglobia bacterium]|nr:NAD(P)-dependent oxidoreductase [Terriglobia bacterium]